jgi:hypothetical protein
MSDPDTRIDPTGAAGEELSFSANAFMPAQFYPVRRHAGSLEPIMRLMARILIDAVRCFQRHFAARESNRRQEFREAKSWIFDDTRNGPFCFLDVCDWLEIDPHSLRDWIVRGQQDRHRADNQRRV